MRKYEGMKKLLSVLLMLSMVLSYIPVPAHAHSEEEGLCQHHPEHTEECGYVPEADCVHQHGEDCKVVQSIDCVHVHGTNGCTYVPGQAAVLCHTCSEEACGYVPGVDCQCDLSDGKSHVENCGYVEAKPCGKPHGEGCGCVAEVPESGECTHTQCTLESSCVTETLICAHTAHDEACGYAEFHSCAYVTNGCADCAALEAAAAHTHAYTGEKTYAKKDGAFHTVTAPCPDCPEGLTEVTGEAHSFTSGVCTLCGAEEAAPACICESACGRNGIDPNCTLCLLDPWNCAYFDPTVCTCAEKCTEETVNYWCPVCGGEDALLASCTGEDTATEFDSYSITVNAGENGSVTAKVGEAAVEEASVGGMVTLTITPAEGFELDTLEVKQGETVLEVHENKFTMPAGAVTITATFKEKEVTPVTYTVTIVEGIANGTVTAEPTTAAEGATVTLTVTANEGYELGSLSVMNGDTPVTVTEVNTFTMPAGNVAVTATFKANVYTVTISETTNGTVAADKATAAQGETVTLTATPATGYLLGSWTVTNADVGSVTVENNQFTMPASAVTVSATFVACDHSGDTNTPTDNMDDTCDICGITGLVASRRDYAVGTIYYYTTLEAAIAADSEEGDHIGIYKDYTLNQSLTLSAATTLHLDMGGVLTFGEGVTLTSSGTVCLPEGTDYADIPTAITGGTVKIGTAVSYTWESENNKWICTEGTHTPVADSYADNEDGTHSFTCSVCGFVTENHSFGTDYTCVCGDVESFTITWEWSGCTYDASMSSDFPEKLAYGDHAFDIENLEAPDGYSFHGFVDGNGNELNFSDSHPASLYFSVSGDMTVKAVIEPITYTVTWNVNGVTSTSEQTYDTLLTLPTAPTKEGCTFMGWFTAAEGGNEVTAETVYKTAGSTTYYAQFCDHSGNTNEVTVNQDGTHSFTCTVCSTTVTEGHSGGTATCMGKKCTTCGAYYGEVDASNHTYSGTCCGSCGESAKWALTGSTLTVSGTGPMADFTAISEGNTMTGTTAPWNGSRERIQTVVVAEGITSIGNYAFCHQYTNLTAVTIPNSATSIGVQAFYQAGLTGVTVPAGVKTIGYQAFSECAALTNVTLNEGLEEIGHFAFTRSGITNLTIPASVTTLGRNLVDGCTALTAIHITGDAPNADSKLLLGAPEGMTVYIHGTTASGYDGDAWQNNNVTLIYVDKITAVEAIADQTYTGSAIEPALTVTNYKGETLTKGTDYTVTYSNNINAGTAAVTVTGAGSYGGKLEASFTITPKPITVTIENMGGTYGSEIPELRASCDGIVEGDTNVYKLSTTATKDSGVGEYPITGEALDSNYAITFVDGTYSIGKACAMVTVQPGDPDLIYTGEDQKLVTAGTSTGGTMKYSTIKDGTYEKDIPVASEVGTYTVWYYVEGDMNHVDSAAYSVTVTIGKAKPVCTATPTANGLTYTGSAQELITAGEADGGELHYSLEENGTYSTSIPQGTKAGEYTVWYYVRGDENHVDSGKASIKVTIEKKVLSLSLSGSVTKVYDGTTAVPKEHSLSVSLNGIINTDYVKAEASYAYDSPNAGTKKVNAAVVLSGDDAGNYTASVSVSADVGEITRADVTYTPPEGITGLKYDGTLQELVTPGTVTGGTFRYSADGAVWSTEIPAQQNAGTYTVHYKIVGDSNHKDVEAAKLEVTVSKADAPTVSIPKQQHLHTAAATGNTVNIEAYLPEDCQVTGYGDPKVTGDFITKAAVSKNGVLTYDTAVTVGTAEGKIELTVEMENYETAAVTVTVELTEKKVVTVTGITAQNGTYNGQPHTGYTGAPGAEGYTGEFAVTYTGRNGTVYEASASAPVNAGDYTVTFAIPDTDQKLTGSASVNFTVAKAPMTLTAQDQMAKVGDAKPAFTYTVSGLVTGEELTTEPTVHCDADMTKPGTYPITLSGADANGNYEIAYIGATLYVTEAGTGVISRVEAAGLTAVPEDLENTRFNTVSAIKQELMRTLVSQMPGCTEDTVKHYDIELQFSVDGGKTWIKATEANFPAGGITVIIPYPAGTGRDTHDFAVSHMFTVTSRKLGTVAGETEQPAVTKTADGIRVTLNGLSPVSVAWTSLEYDVNVSTTRRGTVTVSHDAAAAGTAVTITAKPKYAWYTMKTLEVKDAAGKNISLYSAGKNQYSFTMPASDVTITATFGLRSISTNPQTGDDFNLALWSSILCASALCLIALLADRKRRTGK